MSDPDDPLCNCNWNDQFGHEGRCLTNEQWRDQPSINVTQAQFKQIQQMVEDPDPPTEALRDLMNGRS